MAEIYDLLIIGGGPAGLTAATYARRASRSVLVLEKGAFGGQITWSPKVENFPGLLSVSGTELGDMLLAQAMEQGAEVELEEAVSAALIQADELGVSIGAILRIQSDQMRSRRFERAEKLANEAPVKMLGPLMLCIFPAVFLILLGPVMAKAAHGLF